MLFVLILGRGILRDRLSCWDLITLPPLIVQRAPILPLLRHPAAHHPLPRHHRHPLRPLLRTRRSLAVLMAVADIATVITEILRKLPRHPPLPPPPTTTETLATILLPLIAAAALPPLAAHHHPLHLPQAAAVPLKRRASVASMPRARRLPRREERTDVVITLPALPLNHPILLMDLVQPLAAHLPPLPLHPTLTLPMERLLLAAQAPLAAAVHPHLLLPLHHLKAAIAVPDAIATIAINVAVPTVTLSSLLPLN